MLRFEVESDRDVLVDGIGLLPAGEAVEITEDMVRNFELLNGVKLADAKFPPFVQVSTVLVEEPTDS